MRTAIAIAVALVLAPAVARAEPSRFTLDVSPKVGTMDDTFVATVHVETMGVAGPDRFHHPPFPGFKLLDTKLSTSTSMLFDPQRGQELRTSEVRRYFLQPTRTGRMTVGPAKLRLEGEEYETMTVTVMVNGGGGSGVVTGAPMPSTPGGLNVPGYTPPKPRRRSDAFLYAVVDNPTPYVGEQVTVTWMLFSRSEALGFEPKPPALDDFWFEKLYEPRRRLRYEDTRIGRVPYLATIVSQRALFPSKAGKLVVPPYRADVTTMLSARGRPESLQSQPIELRVRELPEGAPPGFDPSYVGVYSVEANVDRARVEAGESLTLSVTVRGDGAIRRTNPPVIDIPGFKVEGPRDDDPSVDVSSGVVRGERVYRYWLVPERGGELEIPSIAIPYFEPETELYHTARSEGLSVVVSGDPTAARKSQSSGGGLRDNVIAREVRPLRQGAGISSRTLPYLHESGWFWIAAGLPLFAFLSVFVGDKVRERMRKETPRSRLRKARGRARQRMKVADIHLRGARPAQFFGELSRALYEHIEDRVGEPVQSMTREQMSEFLLDKGFPKPTVERIDRELETFDFARFAPSASGGDEMKAAQRRVRELLSEIEKVRTEERA